LAAEGDGDSASFIFGLLIGVALAHNWGLASSGAGLGPNGTAAAFFCLVVLFVIGFALRGKVKTV
jgi:hypothetical protein